MKNSIGNNLAKFYVGRLNRMAMTQEPFYKKPA